MHQEELKMTSTILLASGSWLTLILSLCLLSIILALLVQRGRFLYALRKVPYPISLPIVGNACQLACSPEEFFTKLVKWRNQFGDIFLVWVGLRPFIFLYRAEAIQPLLSSSVHIDKSLEYEYLQPWLGTGLVTSTGDKWHFRRKLLTPTFHSGLLDVYLKTALEEANVLISCLHKEVGKVFDIVPYAKRAALDVICDSSMGCHINAQTNFSNEYVLAVDKIASIMQRRFTNVWISYDPIFKLTTWGKEHDHSLRVIHGFVDKVIADRKAEWKFKQNGILHEPTKKRQKALLDLLLEMSQDGKVLSDEDIREEVNTFMYAGHDTMAISVSWILYALGRNPEYQKRILDEFDEVIGTNEITVEAINKLIWLDACIKESWRLYPVAPLIARQIYSPINIRSDIPKGSTVIINSFLLHRDARHFPEPDLYLPERFLPDRPKYPCYAFIPFSAGSRNCIGWKFATMVVKIIILSVLKAYHVEALDSEEKLRFVAELVLINAGGLKLRVTPRER